MDGDIVVHHSVFHRMLQVLGAEKPILAIMFGRIEWQQQVLVT